MLKRTAALLCLVAILPGCEARNLYVAHKVNLGLNAAYNQAKPSGKLLFGYKEQFVTIIPKSAPINPATAQDVGAGDGARDAMSVLGCSNVKTGFIEIKEFSEYLATGAAAKRFADQIANPAKAGSDIQATKLFAYQLKDTLGKAEAAADTASKKEGIAADAQQALAALLAQLQKVDGALAGVIAGQDDTLAANLQLLLKSDDYKTLEKDFAAVTDADVKNAASGLGSATLQGQLALAQLNSQGLDSAIFSCLKEPQLH